MKEGGIEGASAVGLLNKLAVTGFGNSPSGQDYVSAILYELAE